MGGMLIVPLAMYLLQATNWRLTWVALGMGILVLAVPLAFVFIREYPANLGLLPDGDDEHRENQEYRRPILYGGHGLMYIPFPNWFRRESAS